MKQRFRGRQRILVSQHEAGAACSDPRRPMGDQEVNRMVIKGVDFLTVRKCVDVLEAEAAAVHLVANSVNGRPLLRRCGNADVESAQEVDES